MAAPTKAGRTGTPLSPYQVSYSFGSSGGITRGGGGDWFGPLNPIAPIAPQEVTGRIWDYPSGYNLQTTRRANQPISFELLRDYANTCDVLRLLIETRKDQVARVKWHIGERDEAGSGARNSSKIKPIQAFFKRPDLRHSWSDWLRMILEDMFVVDAPAIFVRRLASGELHSLVPIDGATIKPVIDDWGSVPLAYVDANGQRIIPTAYQQVLKGYPAVDYAAALQPGVRTARDLIYRPRNLRDTTPYGFSPVEQVFNTVGLLLRRQLFLLNYFTEGNQPSAVAGLPTDWSPDQIISYQLAHDDLFSGNLENRRKTKFMPEAAAKTYRQLQEPELTGAFDEYLIRIVCFAFSISPAAFTKMMNRSTAESSKDASEEEGLKPILEWVKSLVDDIIECEFDAPELELVWEQETPVNEAERQVILSGFVGAGIMSRNEAREQLGLDADSDPTADSLMVTTSAGAVPLDANTLEAKQAMADAIGAPGADSGAQTPKSSDPKTKPEPKKPANKDSSNNE